MKHLLLCTACLFLGTAVFAQNGSGLGVKAGLNYNSNGDYFEAFGEAARDPDRNVGYHLGLFGKLEIRKLYLRPELVYTKTKSDYDGDDFDMSKLDAPILLGVNLIGPLHVFAGPSFQYILNTEFDGIDIDDIENDFTVGLHIGVGVNLGRLGIDVRYENGLSDNTVRFVNRVTELNESRIDTRPEQLIVSLSLKL
ncbi:porin family protein [Ulvibacterium sp.]|uniref:porin family protein n=1 Tax=Ulvibacterium sp. TaxID=2665914 RepID=UPI003BA8E442